MFNPPPDTLARISALQPVSELLGEHLRRYRAGDDHALECVRGVLRTIPAYAMGDGDPVALLREDLPFILDRTAPEARLPQPSTPRLLAWRYAVRAYLLRAGLALPPGVALEHLGPDTLWQVQPEHLGALVTLFRSAAVVHYPGGQLRWEGQRYAGSPGEGLRELREPAGSIVWDEAESGWRWTLPDGRTGLHTLLSVATRPTL